MSKTKIKTFLIEVVFPKYRMHGGSIPLKRFVTKYNVTDPEGKYRLKFASEICDKIVRDLEQSGDYHGGGVRIRY